MSREQTADLCIIGAGSGGLAVAAGAAQMGARTVLIEKGRMGGDCLNYGCVPSKALIAAGHHAQALRAGAAFGIAPVEPEVDFAGVHDHVHGVIADIAPHDSQERFESLGVAVIRAPARFAGRREVVAGDHRVRARRIVIATGSSPAVPPIPGLESVSYFTNETIFDNTVRPGHLIVIGGGPIGLELAQAHRRLGVQVTVLEKFSFLAKDDPELSAVVTDTLRDEGVTLLDGTDIDRIEGGAGEIRVHISQDGVRRVIAGSHLLVATGRKANVEGLDLEAAGIRYSARGIEVDARLRTSNRRIFAIGDVVAGGLQFTHVAGMHAGIVIRNALFRLPARARTAALPWVTYTDPELAHVGLDEAAARARHGKVRVMRVPFTENDRARAERRTQGLIKVITNARGRILGASIVGAQAGELIFPWVLALSQGLKIGAMAAAVAPYPTLSEISKRAAGAYFTPALFGARTRRLVRLLARLG